MDESKALRSAARILDEARERPGPRSVEVSEFIPLGGIQQAISIRGRDRDNPVLLFLHGGPGFPTMPVSYTFQAPWEEFFTVVQWDQRGSGRTYAANDPEKVGPTLTLERMVADAEELVTHLRERFGQQRIVLMGHSWGSYLGLELARRHPDWFSVYVGVGQAVDVFRNERQGYEAILAAARRAGNAEAVRELEALAPYPEADGTIPVQKIYVQRKWLTHFGGYLHGRTEDHYWGLVQLSPDYTPEGIDAFGPAISYSFERLWPQFDTVSFLDVTEVGCPVILFQGTHDITVSGSLASEWYERLRAPEKKLVWFEHSAHMVPMEEPGKVFQHLLQDVLPLARTGGASHASR
ncbi:alpha/beta hydrolase [Myxococcus stipitatus]|uniref:alpha/beta fold hydrolase n=1 Tax=Myxococcus stipitatus TaxID=83455 RepID=UPI001F31A52A|nr:alpha/beta hydrolase [Myxococcus stipitatus]MCE9668913.1 alpha/beta hydrolase [Myxococcus stipitatus]